MAVPQPSKLPDYRINIIKNDPNYENNCMLCKEELFVPKHVNKKTCSGTNISIKDANLTQANLFSNNLNLETFGTAY